MKQYLCNGIPGLRLSTFSIDLRKVILPSIAVFSFFFVLGDVLLCFKVQSNHGLLPVGPGPNETFPCHSSPFCSYNVKTLFLDFPNFYITRPLTTKLYHWLNFQSALSVISPTAISIFHVFVACIAGRCVAHDSLGVRWLGVFAYQLRNLLDTLDGTVARSRRQAGLSSPDEQSFGYYSDGICDALGSIALVAGCYFYISRHPTRLLRPYAYTHLPVFVTSRRENEEETEDELETKGPKGKGPLGGESIQRRVALWFLLQALLSSAAWNMYIDKFTDSLESRPGNSSERIRALQGAAVTSTTFWIIIELWRLVNVQAMFQYLCAAIVMDRMGEFMSWIQWYGYVGIVGTALFSEVYYRHIHLYDQL